MIRVNPSAEITEPLTKNPGFIIERAARNCYQSLGSMICPRCTTDNKFWPTLLDPANGMCGECEERNNKFIRVLRDKKPAHLSVFEHATASFIIETDRGITHELVRHRIGFSYSQESTRYAAYGPDGSKKPVRFMKTSYRIGATASQVIDDALMVAENAYLELRDMDIPPEIARSVLPNALGSKIQMTGNARSWREFLVLRWSSRAHPDMRELASIIRGRLINWFKVGFEDIEYV